MWSQSQAKTATQPGSTNSDSSDENNTNALTNEPSTTSLSLFWERDAMDMDILTELLGTISSNNNSHAATEDTGAQSDVDNGATHGVTTITTEAVREGLRSLDEFEQSAAIHVENDGSFNGGETGFGPYNEAELSAALQQIYWNSIGMPGVDPAEISVPPTDLNSPSESLAPTPASTPVVTTEPTYTQVSGDGWAANDPHANVLGYHDDDDEEEDGGDESHPMELEVFSLFSLLLSDMKVFEGFLQDLSLNQLRQCAATVNSVLVQRESTQTASTSTGVQTADDDGAADMADADAEPCGGNGRAAGACESLADLTLSLLRKRLPPSTADCVISELQKKNLLIPTSTRPTGAAAPTAAPGAPDDGAGAAALHPGQPSSAITSASKCDPSTQHIADAASANEPVVETDSEHTPWLSFVYAQKGKPRRHRIRIDIERAPQSAIPASFQQNNCVYPRANCTRQTYAGNRWNYETECNRLGWKLAFLNQELLTARRGLLQTAVNNYRSAVAGRKSRRVTRMEKAERSQGLKRGACEVEGSELNAAGDSGSCTEAGRGESGKRAKTNDAGAQEQMLLTPPPTATGDSSAAPASSRRNTPHPLMRTASAPTTAPLVPSSSSSSAASPQTAKCLLIDAFVNNKFTRIRIYIDLTSTINPGTKIDAHFKRDHAVFPRALNATRSRYDGRGLRGRWEFEVTCNELAWRLVWLNKARLRGRKPLIQK
ncbi:hypothetical protein IWW50_001031, partial [Coemansia erecta]